MAPPGNVVERGRLRIRDWTDEEKNQGVYSSYPNPGDIILSAPQVRPGQEYYIGLRALSDVTALISNTSSGLTQFDPFSLNFSGGSISGVIPPGHTVYYKTSVPSGADTFKYTSTHSSDVSVYIEQGSFPSLTENDDFLTVATVDSVFDRALGVGADSWPWVSDQTYYFALQNVGSTDQPFSLLIGDEPVVEIDSDGDFLPDEWEQAILGSLDFGDGIEPDDGDTNSLLLEYFFGLDPLRADAPLITGTHFGGDSFDISFEKREVIPTLEFVIERSLTMEDENSWQTIPVTSFVLPDSREGFEKLRLRDNTASVDKYFYRVKVTPAN